MKLFSNTRAKRNVAIMVLLGWLFALASGIANACLLDVHGSDHGGSATAALALAHFPAIPIGHAGAITSQGDDSGTSRAPCLKVCDDASRSAPKAFSAIDQVDPGPAAPTAAFWTSVSAARSTPLCVGYLAPGMPGPPIRIRFARLAL